MRVLAACCLLTAWVPALAGAPTDGPPANRDVAACARAYTRHAGRDAQAGLTFNVLSPSQYCAQRDTRPGGYWRCVNNLMDQGDAWAEATQECERVVR